MAEILNNHTLQKISVCMLCIRDPHSSLVGEYVFLSWICFLLFCFITSSTSFFNETDDRFY